MIPILRVLPLAGLFLALLILVLALIPRDRLHRAVAPAFVTARGPLIDTEEHPEWRHFLFRTALRRADEINRLDAVSLIPIQAGSLVQPPEPILLNKPITESLNVTPVSGQDSPLDIKSERLGEPMVDEATAPVASARSHHSADAISPSVEQSRTDISVEGTSIDAGQTVDANPVEEAPKRRLPIRRAKPASEQSNFFTILFGVDPDTPRQNLGKGRRVKPVQRSLGGESQAARGQTSFGTNNKASKPSTKVTPSQGAAVSSGG